jgi:hypothetical protein
MDATQIACEKRLSKDTSCGSNIKKKKILTLEVTSEEVHNSKLPTEGDRMVDNASISSDVRCVITDGICMIAGKIFQYLHNNDIVAPIKVRKNSSGKAMGCYRSKIVILQQLKDFDNWNDSKRYGHRWMTETVFSSFKRMFGEYMSAGKYPTWLRNWS